MTVSSFFPGRIRLRAQVFKDSVIVEKALQILKSSDAVKNVENNKITGSVLLEYYPEKVPMEKLQEALPLLKRLDRLAFHYDNSKQGEILSLLEQFQKIVDGWK